ncbi:MAG: hypothetical protein ABS939_13140 [Psychrobacillus sp.]
MQNWKKTGAALLVATLTVSGAGYAWANNNYDTVNINDVNKHTQETSSASETAQVTPTQAVASTTAATAQTTTNKDLPVELATEKLVGLVKAYETASNDDAKAAILNVINRVIAEYETTQKDIYQKKAPELTAAIDRLIVLFKDYQQAPNADKKAAIIAQVKTVVTELQNYLAKQEEPKENTPPVIVPPIKDKDKDKADRDKKKAELEKKKAEEKAAKEAAKAAVEAKRAQEKAAAEAKRAQEKAEREAAKAAKQAEIEAAKKAKAAELAAKKAAHEQKKADQKPKHPNGKDENRHNKGPKHNQQPKHDKHEKHNNHHNKHDHKNGHHGQGKNDRN